MNETINLSSKTMAKIQKYIKNFSKKIFDKSINIKDFQEEITNHILLNVKEFMEKGYNEDEAFKLATEQFGRTNNIESELDLTFNNIKLKSLLPVSAIIGVISLILYAYVFVSIVILGKALPRYWYRCAVMFFFTFASISFIWGFINIVCEKRNKNFITSFIIINIVPLIDFVINLIWSIGFGMSEQLGTILILLGYFLPFLSVAVFFLKFGKKIKNMC